MKILEIYPKKKTADTLCIIKRTKSKYWYVRFYVAKSFNKSGLFHQSTKCTEKRKAWQRAKDIHRHFDTSKYFSLKGKQKDTFNEIVYKIYDKEIDNYKISYPERNYKNSKWWEKKNRWISKVASSFSDINYRNKQLVTIAGNDCLLMLKIKHKLEEKTITKYKTDMTSLFKTAVDLDYINFVPNFKMPEFDEYEEKPKEWFRYHEINKIIEYLKEETKITRDLFPDEMSDYVNFLRSSPFRPGKETSAIKYKHLTINDKEIDRVIVNIKLPKTKTSKKKKKVHWNSCHPDFTIDVLPRMIERYPDMLPDDYLFFPHIKNRDALDQRIRKTFKRVLIKLGLYYYNGIARTLYNIRHSVFITLNNAGASLEDLARMGNTSIPMLVGSYMKSQEKDGLALNKRVFLNVKERKIQKKQHTPNSIHLAINVD